MRRRFLSLLGMTVFVLSFGAAPAYADGEIGLSMDGTHWSQSLNEPLFDPEVVWVPGDSRIATFLVRNEGPTGSTVILDFRGTGANELLNDGDIKIAALAGIGGWVDLDNGYASNLLSTSAVPVGAQTSVIVRATFDPASTQGTQLREQGLSFRVTLEGVTASGGGQGSGTPTPGAQEIAGFLPGTGAPKVMWIAGIGSIFVGVGLSVVARRRREEEEEDEYV